MKYNVPDKFCYDMNLGALHWGSLFITKAPKLNKVSLKGRWHKKAYIPNNGVTRDITPSFC